MIMKPGRQGRTSPAINGIPKSLINPNVKLFFTFSKVVQSIKLSQRKELREEIDYLAKKLGMEDLDIDQLMQVTKAVTPAGYLVMDREWESAVIVASLSDVARLLNNELTVKSISIYLSQNNGSFGYRTKEDELMTITRGDYVPPPKDPKPLIPKRIY
jgi:hypothetical protein